MAIWLLAALAAFALSSRAVAAGDGDHTEPAILSPEIEQWRRQKIQSLWHRINRDSKAVPPGALTAAVGGDFSGLYGEKDRSWAFIVSGTPGLSLSPAAMLMTGRDGRFWPHCSATLTRPDTALTAAHCVRRLATASQFKIFIPFGGFSNVKPTGITIPCDLDPDSCLEDLAILRLETPYSHIPVARQAPGHAAAPGSTAVTRGFGSTSELLFDNGLAHGGNVTLDDCGCGEGFASSRRLLCFQFEYGRTANGFAHYVNLLGDSGGAMFAAQEPDFALVGIASGVEKSCAGRNVMEGRYIDTRVRKENPWLSSAFCGPACPESQSRDFEILLQIGLAYVDDGSTAAHSISIGSKVEILVLTLNHELPGFRPESSADLELEMPPSLDAKCERHFGVETCEVHEPPPGDYSIGVRRIHGRPAYQITAVALGGQ